MRVDYFQKQISTHKNYAKARIGGTISTYATLFCAFLLLCAGVIESFSSLLLRVLFINSSPTTSPVGSGRRFCSATPLLELMFGPEVELMRPLCCRDPEGEIEGAGLSCTECW